MPRTDPGLLALAEALKREAPRRTATQIAEILAATHGASPHARTLQRHFRPSGAEPASPTAGHQRAFWPVRGRPARTQLWTGDALHGPVIAGRKAYLFGFIDDHSRLLVGLPVGRQSRTPCGWKPRCAQGWPPAGYPTGCMSTTARRSSPTSCVRACATLGDPPGPQPARANQPAGAGRSSASSAPCAASSWSSSRPAAAPPICTELQPAVRRLGGGRLPPARSHRDRPAAAGTLPTPATPRRGCPPRPSCTRRFCGRSAGR